MTNSITMANTNTIANTNTMANANTMTNTNTMTNSDSLRVSSSAIIGDLGNISSDVIRVIVDMLGPAVRKVDAVVTLPGSCPIVRFHLVEPCSSHFISHSILVGVGGNLPKVIVAHRMGHTNTVSNTNSMPDSNSMPNANAVSNSNAVSDANSMSNANTTSEELRCCRSGNNQGREVENGLHDVGCL